MRFIVFMMMMWCMPTLAVAETVNYGYDALGRVVGIGRHQGAADGIREDVYLDTASNRTLFVSRDTRITLPSGQSLSSPDGRTILAMQADGNLVVYFQGKATWSTATNGSNGNRMVVQSDGNIVIYTQSNIAVWNSGTNGKYGAFLAIQNDGNVVIYDVARTAIWNTGTGGH